MDKYKRKIYRFQNIIKALAFVVILLCVPPSTIFGAKYPEKLDDAASGEASKDNPFFTVVLNPPIISGWAKISNNLYESPTGALYEYNPDTGRFGMPDGSVTSGYNTYDQWSRLIRRLAPIYDSQGVLIGWYEYLYTYNEDGSLKEYTRNRYDAEWTKERSERYSDYEYFPDGTLKGYREAVTNYDANGDPTYYEVYVNDYIPDAGRIERIRNERYAIIDGRPVLSTALDLVDRVYQDGNLISYNVDYTFYNTSTGEITGFETTTQEYIPEGNRLEMTHDYRYASVDGQPVLSLLYDRYNFTYSSGTLTGYDYTYTYYDAGGNITGTDSGHWPS